MDKESTLGRLDVHLMLRGARRLLAGEARAAGVAQDVASRGFAVVVTVGPRAASAPGAQGSGGSSHDDDDEQALSLFRMAGRWAPVPDTDCQRTCTVLAPASTSSGDAGSARMSDEDENVATATTTEPAAAAAVTAGYGAMWETTVTFQLHQKQIEAGDFEVALDVWGGGGLCAPQGVCCAQRPELTSGSNVEEQQDGAKMEGTVDRNLAQVVPTELVISCGTDGTLGACVRMVAPRRQPQSQQLGIRVRFHIIRNARI